ncbi:MAG: hypothetical protein LBT59_01805 [Clostridiales bacterium]|jgi:hypothetical protein|nr:hypothetical protein [Clostridiales bacterium]
MKRLIKQGSLFVSILFSLVLFIVLPMISIPPLIQENHSFEARIAKSLLQFQTFYYDPNYNEKLVQELFIRNNSTSFSTVVIGSSRGMLLDSDITGETSIFNNCVSGATFEDVISLVGMYYTSSTGLPKKLIIEISPWNMSETLSRQKYVYNKDYEQLYSVINADMLPAKNFNLTYLKNLFSSQSFRRNCQILLDLFFNHSIVYFEKIDDKYYTKYPDGSLGYGSKMTDCTSEEILNKINSVVIKNEYSTYINSIVMDGSKEHQLDLLTNWLIDQGIDVIMYLAPFPPTVYDYIVYSKNLSLNKIEEHLLLLADKYNITVRGSYNPYKNNLKDIDFYDGLHVSKRATPTVWNYIARSGQIR